MTLPTFAAEHQSLQHGTHSYRSTLIAGSLSSKPLKPPMLLSINGTYGWMRDQPYSAQYTVSIKNSSTIPNDLAIF